MARNSLKKLVIINGHSSNKPALNYAAQMTNRNADYDGPFGYSRRGLEEYESRRNLSSSILIGKNIHDYH